MCVTCDGGGRGRAEGDDLDRLVHALEGDRGERFGHDPLRQLEAVEGGEQLAGFGDVAQSRRDVDRPADVVVALEEDDVAGCDAAPEGQPARVGVTLLDGEGGADERFGVDPDEHDPVAEPLLDPHAEHGADLADGGAEGLQFVHGPLVAVVVDEVREGAQVDEREGPRDAVIDGDGGEFGGVHGGSCVTGGGSNGGYVCLSAPLDAAPGRNTTPVTRFTQSRREPYPRWGWRATR